MIITVDDIKFSIELRKDPSNTVMWRSDWADGSAFYLSEIRSGKTFGQPFGITLQREWDLYHKQYAKALEVYDRLKMLF